MNPSGRFLAATILGGRLHPNGIHERAGKGDDPSDTGGDEKAMKWWVCLWTWTRSKEK
jgi:hypothetical protein